MSQFNTAHQANHDRKALFIHNDEHHPLIKMLMTLQLVSSH